VYLGYTDRYAGKKIWSDNLKITDHLRDLDVERKIRLKWILEKCGVSLWIGFKWFRIGSNCEFCEFGNETLCSIKSGISVASE
jgi:hypothetical protein